jgi:hypothetical protein
VVAESANTSVFLAGGGPLFADRCAHGRVVDGHGELIADDIFCLDDGPRALDCLEFDDPAALRRRPRRRRLPSDGPGAARPIRSWARSASALTVGLVTGAGEAVALVLSW